MKDENLISPVIKRWDEDDYSTERRILMLLGTDLRKMVFGSSSIFSGVLRVPQNQWEFIEIGAALGFVFTVICIISKSF